MRSKARLTDERMNVVAVTIGLGAFVFGTWAYFTDRFGLAALALVVELVVGAFGVRQRKAGEHPHSMPRDKHFDR